MILDNWKSDSFTFGVRNKAMPYAPVVCKLMSVADS